VRLRLEPIVKFHRGASAGCPAGLLLRNGKKPGTIGLGRVVEVRAEFTRGGRFGKGTHDGSQPAGGERRRYRRYFRKKKRRRGDREESDRRINSTHKVRENPGNWRIVPNCPVQLNRSR
jgi:hypothetical protein